MRVTDVLLSELIPNEAMEAATSIRRVVTAGVSAESKTLSDMTTLCLTGNGVN
jgi:hypothetical protein